MGIKKIEFKDVSYGQPPFALKSFSCALEGHETVALLAQQSVQYDYVWQLLHHQKRPTAGEIRLHPRLHVYSDQLIQQSLNLEVSLSKNRQSRLFEDRPWFAGKRCHASEIFEALQLSVHEQRQPLRELGEITQTRALCACVALAQTHCMVLWELLKSKDSVCQSFMKTWVSGYSGMVILFGNPSWLPNGRVISINR